jgi:AraC-like DNA-binding protein
METSETRPLPTEKPQPSRQNRNVVFNTDDVPQRLRQDYWDDFMGRVYLKMRTQVPDPSTFFASMESRQVGEIALIKGAIGANSIDRNAPTGVDQCLLFINLDKPITFRHNDRDVTLNAGDMTILDSRRPSSSSTPFGAETLFINMPRQDLARRFPSIEHIAGTAFTAASPLASFSREYFKNLFDVAPDLSPHLSSWFEEHALDIVGVLLAEAVAMKPRATAYRHALLYRLKAFIQQNLHDPNLSVGSVAYHFKISSRYVARLFSGEGKTFTHLVQAERLNECRRLLAMPSNAAIQISQIAYSVGFRSQANFNRLFREAYDLTPSDYRASVIRKGGL